MSEVISPGNVLRLSNRPGLLLIHNGLYVPQESVHHTTAEVTCRYYNIMIFGGQERGQDMIKHKYKWKQMCYASPLMILLDSR